MLKKKNFFKLIVSFVFCCAFFATSLMGATSRNFAQANEIPQESTPPIYEETGDNWACSENILSLNGVNWLGVLELTSPTEMRLENSSTNTIAGEDNGTALVLNGDVTITGAGIIEFGVKDVAASDLIINFENGGSIIFSGECKVQIDCNEELTPLTSPLTEDSLEDVNYIKITTSDYSESESPDVSGPETGGSSEGGIPEGGDPSGGTNGDTPLISAIENNPTINYALIVNGKYNVSNLFNFINCDELTKTYYLVSEDGQNETSLTDDELEITAAGTFKIKVKASDAGGASVAECMTTLVVEKESLSLSLAFEKWEYGEQPTPVISGNVPLGANVSYKYYTDAEHLNEVTTNDGVPTEIGIYYAVASIESTPTTNEVTLEASFEIVKKTIAITWSADDYTYNGSVQVVTASYETGGRTVELQVTIDKEFKNAQTYTATASFKNGEINYILPDNPTNSYTINKRAVTIQINNKRSTYLENLSSLTATVRSGSIVSGETPYELSSLARNDVMGEYDIIGQTTNENYDIYFINGKYTVENKITSLSIADWQYGEEPNIPEAVAFYGQDQIVYTYTSVDSSYNSTIAPTEPGRYYVNAEINLPEKYYCASKSVAFTISRLVLEEPIGDTTTYTYDGQYKIYNLDGQNEYYTVTGAIQSQAGTHKVKVTLSNANHYKWQSTDNDTIEYTFVINKMKVEKPAKDTRKFKYTGFNLTYSVAESNNYNVIGNIQSELGTHIVTIELADKNNTCWSDGSTKDLKFEFVIRGSVIDNPHTTTADGNIIDTKPVTIIASDGNGIDPEFTLNVLVAGSNDKKIVQQVKDKLSNEIGRYDAIHTVYDVTLQKSNVEVQPDGTITLKIFVPEELRNVNFKLYHVHTDSLGNASAEEIACSVSNQGFVVIQVDKLSDFVFVYKQNSLQTLIIIFAITSFVFSALLGVQLFLFFKNRKNSGKKASNISLALMPAMFVSGEVVWSIVLGISSVLLLAANILLFVLLLKKGIIKKINPFSKNKVETNSLNRVDEIKEVEKNNEGTEKDEVPKSEDIKQKTKSKLTTDKKSVDSSKHKSAVKKNTEGNKLSKSREKTDTKTLDLTKKK